MRELIRDREHLVRLALIFAAGFVAFVLVRSFVIPKGFGVYGHYRAGALDDVSARGIHFAGRASCADCHDDLEKAKAAGKHAGLGCEACHGAQAAHVADAANVVPGKLDPKTLCPVCHTTNVAKPKGFPQVDPKDHAGDQPCTDCHKPHAPSIA